VLDEHLQPAIKVFQIEPLNRAQVKKFAQAKLNTNPQAFIEALDEHFAWEFARRPLDVIGLLSFWKQKGRLGSLRELIIYGIEVNLQENSRLLAHILPHLGTLNFTDTFTDSWR